MSAFAIGIAIGVLLAVLAVVVVARVYCLVHRDERDAQRVDAEEGAW